MSAYPDVVDLTAHREGLLRVVSTIARRAQAQRSLRRDFDIGDLVLILQAGRGLAAVPAPSREGAVRRFAAIAIDGLRERSGPTVTGGPS